MLKITFTINHVEKKVECHKRMARDYNHHPLYGAAPLDKNAGQDVTGNDTGKKDEG